MSEFTSVQFLSGNYSTIVLWQIQFTHSNKCILVHSQKNHPKLGQIGYKPGFLLFPP